MEIRTYLKSGLLFLLMCGALTLSGCKKYKVEYSEPIKTTGRVIEKEHIKESYLNPIDDINPMKDIDPFFDFRKGRIVTKREEKFNVYIDTSIGRFKINNREIYNNFEKNSVVDVCYHEIYKCTYEGINKDGKDKLLERKLTEYEFIDAHKK